MGHLLHAALLDELLELRKSAAGGGGGGDVAVDGDGMGEKLEVAEGGVSEGCCGVRQERNARARAGMRRMSGKQRESWFKNKKDEGVKVDYNLRKHVGQEQRGG
jgi:hypothetical protein